MDLLRTRYEEFDRLQQQKLLMEVLGATSEEEVQSLIMSDMFKFTEYMSTHMEDFFNDQISAFANFNTLFSDFLEDYKYNLGELYDFETEYVDVISADDWLPNNDEYLDTDPIGEMESKKQSKVVYQTLYEIVQNDSTLIGKTIDNKLRDTITGGFIDYSQAALDNLKDSDYYQAVYDLMLREVKIANNQDNYGQFNMDELFERWSKSGEVTNEQIAQLRVSMDNAYAVEEAINKINEARAIAAEGRDYEVLQIESDTSQFVAALASNLPAELSAQSAEQLLQMVESTGMLSSNIDGVGLSVSEDLHSNAEELINNLNNGKDALVDYLVKICDYIKPEEAEKAVEAAIQQTAKNSGGSSSGSTVKDTSGESYTTYDYSSAYSDNGGYVSPYDTGGSYIGGSSATTSNVRAEAAANNSSAAIAAANKQIEAAQQAYNAAKAAGDTAGMTNAHNAAQAARESLGYKANDDGTGYIPVASRANGIEGGPITYTGLAMLHGTPSKPEYVLNNDQAYSLLRFMANSKPEFTSTFSGQGDINYTFENITMNEVNSAEEFFCELNRAMDARHNLLKHKK